MNNNRGANSCLALATLQAMFSNTTNATSIAIFKGTIPDLDASVPLLSTNNTFTASSMFPAIGATSDNCLAVLRLPQLTPVYDPQTNVWRVGLSSLTANMLGLATGTPTYALVRQSTVAATADNYAAGFANGVNVNNLLLVTVGADTSDAELRILGGQIVSGQSYRMTDLQISL